MPALPVRLWFPKVRLPRAEQARAVLAALVVESAEAEPRKSKMQRRKLYNHRREAVHHRRTSPPIAAFR